MKFFLIIPLCLMTILSCVKEEKTVVAAVSILSLADLKANSVGEARIFLENTAVTDNSALSTHTKQLKASIVGNIQLEEEEDSEWPRIKWGFGTGCNWTPGICFIFDALQGEIPTERIDSSNAKIYYINEDKLVIEPKVSGEGLTSDSYLPISNYVSVSSKLAIKPGIYLGTSERVIVDLVKIN